MRMAWRLLVATALNGSTGPDPDSTLIQHALAGREAARQQLLRRLAPVISAHVRRAMTREVQALFGASTGWDIVQQVWLVLLRAKGRQLLAYDPTRGASLETYIGRITDREIDNEVQRARAKKRGGDWIKIPLEDLPVASHAPNPERQTVDADLAARLSAHLMATLPTRGQLIFRLLFTDECTADEVALTLGVKRQVVYNWQHRIRAAAREFSARQAESV